MIEKIGVEHYMQNSEIIENINKPDIKKLVKNIRENGVKVFIVANKNSENLTQLDFRIMIEKNLDRMKNKSIQCQNFAEIVESLKDIIEFKEEKIKSKVMWFLLNN